MTSFAPSKHLELPDAKISVVVGSNAGKTYLEVKSDKSARFVCLSIPGNDAIFSDNYFDLPAGRTVIVNVESEVDSASLSRIEICSLNDSY
jgi:beta-mannosidase